MLALEINDASLQLLTGDAGGTARVLASEPGVATVQGRNIVTGKVAAAQAKVQPLNTYHRFWLELSADPLGRAQHPTLSAADLAFEQLKSLLAGAAADAADAESKVATQLLIAVPAGYSRDQLGLLLGVVAETGVKEVGLVDAALAACALTPVGAHSLHLELYRHRAILTSIEREPAGARRARYEIDAQCGVQRLHQLCLDTVASQFVRQTRFDPLHQARSAGRTADRDA
jgi:hypothetical protein